MKVIKLPKGVLFFHHLSLQCRSLERGPVSREWATELLRASGITLTLTSVVAERLERTHRAREAGPLMGQGIRVLREIDWAIRVVFGGIEVYSSSAKDFLDILNC